MDFAAKHAGYVIACYAISLLVLAALLAWTLYRNRTAKRAVDQT